MGKEISYITLPDRKLAYQQYCAPKGKGYESSVMFLGGFGSDMTGTKASFLSECCENAERGFLRFDYSGHGQSSGKFTDGTIGTWLDDTLTIFDKLTTGKQLIVGSSMGGWIGLLLAKIRPERIAGFIGVAAAPDFSYELILPNLTPKQQEQLKQNGIIYEEDPPTEQSRPITQKFMEESGCHRLFAEPLALNFPVHLIQGQKDTDVPWEMALRLSKHIKAPSVRVTLIKDGDHRLSHEQDLDLLWRIVESNAM